MAFIFQNLSCNPINNLPILPTQIQIMTIKQLPLLKLDSKQLTLIFSTGVSALCLNDIVRHEQLHEARERIQKENKDGEDVTAKL